MTDTETLREAEELAAAKAIRHERQMRWEPLHEGHCIADARAALSAAGQARAEHTTVEWGIRVTYPSTPALEGFTSPVPSEAVADRNVAADRPGTHVTKVRRQVTPWEDA